MDVVTIIIPSYNHGKFLRKRLTSIVHQTYTNWELIIIEDCSKDDSLKILREFQLKHSSKIAHFIVNKENSGSGYTSWEKGITLAKTKYIWIAETDDYSDPQFLEKQLAVLEKTNAALSFCGSNYVDENENYLYNSTKRTSDLNVDIDSYKLFTSDVFMNGMPFNTYITNGSSVVFKKPKEKIPSDIFKFKQASDIFLWTYLLEHNTFVFLNIELNYFRRHDDSTSTKITKFRQGSVYYEKAAYLNMFNQQSKYKKFIKHYIKYYIWKHKNQVLDTKALKTIDKAPFKILNYYLEFISFGFKRILNKILK
ncbi:glycosyltransferase [uncultured Polaribacter sp.]|uniref:glycosyltransferase family 2 protein n=1 Tax=uncultured Polaribacter sp. TaxID=174711 RepID=UPI0026110661|nr:glycosyltransferase [uncultured Polaribacter sp.]